MKSGAQVLSAGTPNQPRNMPNDYSMSIIDQHQHQQQQQSVTPMRSNQKILMRNEDSMNMFMNQGQSVPTRKEGVSSNQYGR